MAISQHKAEALIDALNTAKQKGMKLELRLTLAGEAAATRKVRAKHRTLSREIDGLLAKAMQGWQGSGAALERDLKASNRKLQRSIHAVRKKADRAEAVVKALGHLDDAIEVAAKLLGTVV